MEPKYDSLSNPHDAGALAYQIRQYWIERGYKPKMKVEKFRLSDDGPTYYNITSDISPFWSPKGA